MPLRDAGPPDFILSQDRETMEAASYGINDNLLIHPDQSSDVPPDCLFFKQFLRMDKSLFNVVTFLPTVRVTCQATGGLGQDDKRNETRVLK